MHDLVIMSPLTEEEVCMRVENRIPFNMEKFEDRC
jgi:hypothetical protein